MTNPTRINPRAAQLAGILAPHQAILAELDIAYDRRRSLRAQLDSNEETIRDLTVRLYDSMTIDIIKTHQETGK